MMPLPLVSVSGVAPSAAINANLGAGREALIGQRQIERVSGAAVIGQFIRKHQDRAGQAVRDNARLDRHLGIVGHADLEVARLEQRAVRHQRRVARDLVSASPREFAAEALHDAARRVDFQLHFETHETLTPLAQQESCLQLRTGSRRGDFEGDRFVVHAWQGAVDDGLFAHSEAAGYELEIARALAANQVLDEHSPVGVADVADPKAHVDLAAGLGLGPGADGRDIECRAIGDLQRIALRVGLQRIAYRNEIHLKRQTFARAHAGHGLRSQYEAVAAVAHQRRQSLRASGNAVRHQHERGRALVGLPVAGRIDKQVDSGDFRREFIDAEQIFVGCVAGIDRLVRQQNRTTRVDLFCQAARQRGAEHRLNCCLNRVGGDRLRHARRIHIGRRGAVANHLAGIGHFLRMHPGGDE